MLASSSSSTCLRPCGHLQHSLTHTTYHTITLYTVAGTLPHAHHIIINVGRSRLCAYYAVYSATNARSSHSTHTHTHGRYRVFLNHVHNILLFAILQYCVVLWCTGCCVQHSLVCARGSLMSLIWGRSLWVPSTCWRKRTERSLCAFSLGTHRMVYMPCMPYML